MNNLTVRILKLFFQTLTNLAFPLTQKALDALNKFREERTDYVQVTILISRQPIYTKVSVSAVSE